MNVADCVVELLAANGVTHIFGYPGSPLLPLLDAIKRQSAVQWVLMRHENAAALAASAHARMTGRLGVCVATSGPGVLNFVCGVVDAHMDRVPLLALSGLLSTAQQGHWEFQDIDQAGLLRAVVGKSATAADPEQALALLRNLAGHALHRQEAVHLALPSNILSAPIDEQQAHAQAASRALPTPPRLLPPPAQALDQVAGELEKFERVVIVAGRRALGCGPAIEALARKLGAPIMTTLDGKGIIDESNPLSLGVLGVFGFPALETSKRMVRRADAIVAFGVDSVKPFLSDALDVQQRVLVQCEADCATLTTDYHRSHTLLGPLDAIARGLHDRVRRRLIPWAVAELLQQTSALQAARLVPGAIDPAFVHPLAFLQQLGVYLDRRSVLALDTGAHTLWAAHALQLAQRQRVLVSSRLGTMGFSLPAAIAAQLAQPDHRVVALCGDGGIQMVLGELATAVQYRLPIVVVVFNNGLLHNVSAQQTVPFGTELQNPDFVALARAFGADGALVDGSTNIAALIQRAFERRSAPFVIELRCDPRIPPPLSTWDDVAVPPSPLAEALLYGATAR